MTYVVVGFLQVALIRIEDDGLFYIDSHHAKKGKNKKMLDSLK